MVSVSHAAYAAPGMTKIGRLGENPRGANGVSSSFPQGHLFHEESNKGGSETRMQLEFFLRLRPKALVDHPLFLVQGVIGDVLPAAGKRRRQPERSRNVITALVRRRLHIPGKTGRRSRCAGFSP